MNDFGDYDIDKTPIYYPSSLLRTALESALSSKIDSPAYSFSLPPILGRSPMDPGAAAWLGGTHLPYYITVVIQRHRCSNDEVYDYVFIHNVTELLSRNKTVARLVRKAHPEVLMSNEGAADTLKVFLGLSDPRGIVWMRPWAMAVFLPLVDVLCEEYAKLDKSARRKRVRPGFEPPEFFRCSKCPKLSVYETHCDPTPRDTRSEDVPINTCAPWWSSLLSVISTVYHASYMSMALRVLLPMAWHDSISSPDLRVTQGIHDSGRHLGHST
ncbi:hypothetical protein Hypma_001358 [Hypsizygus marmoreus]|uniref:Uncharacterized protein n=1 Tax=Hypsizygus marmoreus TaxID=39966 RepID=A0A369K5X1_HYPMA|nr:hypothetical protein Hypma_001358 [Hypsizygus marmoreus]